MIKSITSTQLTHDTKNVIKYVVVNRQPVIISNYNEPIAVIIDFPSWEELKVKKAPKLSKLLKYMTPLKETNMTKIIRKMRDAE